MATIHTVERWDGKPTVELRVFFFLKGMVLSEMYGDKFNWKNFNIVSFAQRHRVMICRRNDEPIGFMLSRLGPSVFDPDLVILSQTLLYADPGTRAAYLLMQDFIDFGKKNANHIITVLNTKTNIKRQSLEKLGFQKCEEQYRIEV